MATYGPQSAQDQKFEAIRREQNYAAKRLLILQLSPDERQAFNAQQQEYYRTDAPAKFTPTADYHLKAKSFMEASRAANTTLLNSEGVEISDSEPGKKLSIP